MIVIRGRGAAEFPSYAMHSGVSRYPVSGGHKYRDLVLHVGGWARGGQPRPVKLQMSRNLKNRKRRPSTGPLGHIPLHCGG